MEILLVRPPFKYFKDSNKASVSLPVGLLYIAGILEKHNHDVSIYDAQLDINNPFKEDVDAMYIGHSWETYENKISRHKADIIGLSCAFSTQYENVVKAAKIAKRVHNNAIIIAGGPHASIKPEDFLLKHDYFDMVCIGEGELTMLELADRLSRGEDILHISGTAVRYNGSVRVNASRGFIEDLDNLPLPAYHLVNLEDYFYIYTKGYTDRPYLKYAGSERAVPIITSRGCPFKCVFCSIYITMGRGYRAHSATKVLEHIKILKEKYNIRHIHFEDDNISYNNNRFDAILEGLKEPFGEVTWDAPNGIRIDTLTHAIIKKIAETRCLYLVFGIESGNQDVLDRVIDKKLDLRKAVEVISLCHKENLDLMAFFIIGFPGETKDQMLKTIRFALMLERKYDVMSAMFIATPLPGTRLEKVFIEKNLIKESLVSEQLSRMTHGNFILNGDVFSSGDINNLLKLFYRKFKLIFIRNNILFLVFHPWILFKMIKEKITKKEDVLNILEHKRYILRYKYNA